MSILCVFFHWHRWDWRSCIYHHSDGRVRELWHCGRCDESQWRDAK